jgi:hypothetical protein
MLRIKEAIKIHNLIHPDNKLTQTDIAKRLFPHSSPAVRRVIMYRMSNNHRKEINPQWIRIIAQMTGVRSDFILGSQTNIDYGFNDKKS